MLSADKRMPLYEYELCDGQCTVCGGKFTLRRPLQAAPCTQCPLCKRPVRKLISTFSSPVQTKPVSITDAKKAGFTVLKRTGKGDTKSNKAQPQRKLAVAAFSAMVLEPVQPATSSAGPR